MIECVKTVTIDDPDFAGTYTVEPQGDGTLVLEPVMISAEEIMASQGLRELTEKERERHFGEVPSDGEG